MTNKTLRLLAVTFDTPLQSWEIPAFRGAIAQKVGEEHDWFHNHDNQNETVHYRYPLIQYKCLYNNPMLMCIDKGVEEAHHFFSQPDWSISIQGDPRAMPIKKLDLREHHLQITDKVFWYRMYNWLPLGQDDYKAYQELQSLVQRVGFLQPKLLSHALTFAEGIDWNIEENVEINIQEILDVKYVSFKKQKMKAFDFIFTSNIFIPNMVGLGRGVSHGFGVVRPYNPQ